MILKKGQEIVPFFLCYYLNYMFFGKICYIYNYEENRTK